MARLQNILVSLIMVLIPSWAAATSPSTFLTLQSQPGDYVGQGQTVTFTPSDGTFQIRGHKNSSQLVLDFQTPDLSSYWSVLFISPNGAKLGLGEYEGASSAPPNPNTSTLQAAGDGRYCFDTGRFLISDLTFAADGSVQSLAIDFEQHCNAIGPALYGVIRYNSTVTATPRLAVGGVTTLKGSAGTSDVQVTLSLSMPSTKVASVHYATVDGTAVQGTDYLATTGTAMFQPGVTSQLLRFPILGDRISRGNKRFQVALSTPKGALMGDGTALVNILDSNFPMNVLAMSSQPGDYIGGGQMYLFTTADGPIKPIVYRDHSVSMQLFNGYSWVADFAAPDGAVLAKGDYPNAQRYPFQASGFPGLSVDAPSVGCNTLTGNFQVQLAKYAADGTIQQFPANFEQHCEGMPPALFGWVRFHSTLQQFSVTNAIVSGSSAVFTVTLNPVSATNTNVQFSTADGTAIAGKNYVSTSQTVTFSPGQQAQTVTVPLLTHFARPRTFYGQLSAPSGAAVWIAQGTAKF